MRHMQHICRMYAPHISPNSAYFASKSSAYFKKILHNKPTSLFSSNSSSSSCCCCCRCCRCNVLITSLGPDMHSHQRLLVILVILVVVVVVVAWTVKSWGGCFNSHEVCSTSGTSGSMSIVDRGLPEPTWLSGHSIVLLSAMCQPTCIRLLVSSSSSSSSSASSSSIKSREHHRLEK